MVIACSSIVALSSASDHRPPGAGARQISATTWTQFVGVILALSGVEAIANMTGVMKLDPGSTAEQPEGRADRDEGDLAGRGRSGARHGAARLGDAFAAA